MSENEEKDRHMVAPEPTVIVLNQQSEHRLPYPADPPDDSNKRAKIPSIPSTATTVADLKEASTAHHTEGVKQGSSERNTQNPETTALSKQNLNQASAMLSSPTHLPEIAKPFEDIVLATVDSEPVLKVIPSEPIPLELKPTRSRGSLRSRKSAGEESGEEDAVPAREATAISDWSDEQEAGGLPRTASRASRVSRAVRQLICCGVAYSPASEDDISTDRDFSAI